MKHKELKKQLITDKENKKFYRLMMRYKKQFKNDWNLVKKQLREDFGDIKFEALDQLSKARYEQSKKIKDHLKFLINRDYDLYFGTFTYSDDLCPNISADNLKQRVYRAVKQFDDFITNIDYGEKNKRLHFHSVIAIKKDSNINMVSKKEYLERLNHPDSKKIKGKYFIIPDNKELNNYEKNTGYYLLQKIKINSNDIEKVSNYISKLSSHSLKEKQSRVGVKTNSDFQNYKKSLVKLNKLKNLEELPIRIDTRDMINFHKDIYKNLYGLDPEFEKSNLRREKEEKQNWIVEQSIKDWESWDGTPIEEENLWEGLDDFKEKRIIICEFIHTINTIKMRKNA